MDDTGIANLCLGRLGVGQVIAALTENTAPAKTCRRFYDQCRQEVLRAHPWNFGLRAEPLALVANQTFPGWTYVYQYPVNCLMMRAIGDQGGLRTLRNLFLCNDPTACNTLQQLRIPFQVVIKDDNASRVIVTDMQTAWGFFTVDVTNTGVFPPDFSSAFADKLASEVGGPLQAKAELIQLARTSYMFTLSQATAGSMNEAKDDTRPESPSISCRM